MSASPFLLAADIIDPPPARRRPIDRYRNDRVAWVHDCILWQADHGPTGYQEQILAALDEYKRAAVRGPHGIGKTALDAWVVLHFATTRDGEDWKCPTTASVWRQLTKFLWPEIHKWARLLDWAKIGRAPFTRFELLEQNLKLTTGEAFAVASDDPAAIEGAHGDSLLYLLDEAKTIPGETFDAIEGAFSGAGPDTPVEAFALANSTPGETNGRFYEIHQRRAGYEDWHTIHVTLDDAIAAGRISADWAEQRAKQWGAGSAVYANRVLGEFAASDEDSIIPLGWIELANERWREYLEGGRTRPRTCVGVDVARSGADRTVIADRHGPLITELRRLPKGDTMETTGNVAPLLAPGVHATVDVIGIGAGVVDRLRELDLAVVAFNASEHTDRKDRSGELGFTNKRSAAWWNMRELLDPANREDIALPPDDLLTGDLTAPHWRVMSGGKIQVEPKDAIRKRIGRSTDDGDAVVQAFWPETPVTFDTAAHTTGPKPITAGVLTADF